MSEKVLFWQDHSIQKHVFPQGLWSSPTAEDKYISVLGFSLFLTSHFTQELLLALVYFPLLLWAKIEMLSLWGQEHFSRGPQHYTPFLFPAWSLCKGGFPLKKQLPFLKIVFLRLLNFNTGIIIVLSRFLGWWVLTISHELHVALLIKNFIAGTSIQ